MVRLLPHEIVFGLFLVITTVRLLVAAGPAHEETMVYIAAVVVNALAIWAPQRWPEPWAWRLQFVFYIIALNGLFLHMRWAIPLIHPGKYDDLLMGWDQALFGGSPNLWFAPMATPLLTEVMSIAYAAFIPGLMLTLVQYAMGDLRTARAFYGGLFTLYGIGYLGYTLLPAVGPYVAMAHQFDAPLDGYWITDLLTTLYPVGTNGCDAFPSLHVAASAYILLFDLKHRRRWFYACLVPCLVLWLSTVYLRYHYGVDVVAGFALAALGLWVAVEVWRRDSALRVGIRAMARMAE
ncbi:phosphatase PAP2 family protein [Vineibacter terrae]|uniref:phosphatase PAP2 family protein n=1 Tax=Vineibacter terrae TaxID=2586908 RepID=UPI002E317D5F|nr:phosphatase PAP2 family protein [Vineibacter terrae]HEX2885424.1 phosphatase PAP2 family protein [Vineibacter terrae]